MVTEKIRNNDKVLKTLVTKKKNVVTKKELEAEGFNFEYCTHYRSHFFFNTKHFYFEHGIEILSSEKFRIIKTDMKVDS
jgi:hypothetical protein